MQVPNLSCQAISMSVNNATNQLKKLKNVTTVEDSTAIAVFFYVLMTIFMMTSLMMFALIALSNWTEEMSAYASWNSITGGLDEMESNIDRSTKKSN